MSVLFFLDAHICFATRANKRLKIHDNDDDDALKERAS